MQHMRRQRGRAAPRRWRGGRSAEPWHARPGILVLPLRLFLGVAFAASGALKLIDPAFLNGSSPHSAQAQLLQGVITSPISWLVSIAAGNATPFALLLAFVEIVIGVCTLLGLLTRVAAVAGVLVCLSLFLALAWNVPSSHGSDLAYLFAWTPLVIAGDGGVLSLTGELRRWIRRRMRLPALAGPGELAVVHSEVERRTVVRSGLVAAMIGGFTVVSGGLLAYLRRPGETAVAALPGKPLDPGVPGSKPVSAQSPAAGVVLAQTKDLDAGTARAFTGPDGQAAWLVHTQAGRFFAYHAACPHQGCPVSWADKNAQFECPCHGAIFDGDGQVVRGPAIKPLTQIPVVVTHGVIRTN